MPSVWNGWREAKDAASACTEVKMKDTPRLLNLPETERGTIWMRVPHNRRQSNWDSIDDPVVHSLAGLLWKRTIKMVGRLS